MMLCRFSVAFAAVGLLTLAELSSVQAETSELRSVQELFEHSGKAYRLTPYLEVTLTTSVEIPGSEPSERITRYMLGKGREAVIEIGSLMRVLVTSDHVLVENLGVDDRFLKVPVEGGDLGTALAATRGKLSLAGFWEPPQAALRAGKPLDEVLEAFRYSRLMGELSVAELMRVPGSVYELRLAADNGSCVARFDSTSFHLVEVEYIVEPSGAPEGYAMRLTGHFATRELDDSDGLFFFDGGDRQVVESIRDLVAEPRGIDQPPEAILSPEVIADRLLDLESLATALRDKRVLLVGEDHLYEEPPEYMAELLERLDDRPVSLLLEMPRDTQPLIETYLQTGEEAVLNQIFTGKPILQLQHLLRWVFAHREAVPAVLAFDEPLYEIRLKRAYLTDTRNITMSQMIYREWNDHPDRRIVAYAGQLHMMKTGRYLVNHPSRDTAGSRLPALGVPPEDITGLMLNGADNFHLGAVWSQPGAMAMGGGPERIPIPYLIDYPIFGLEFADEAFDYFVNLGTLTKIELEFE